MDIYYKTGNAPILKDLNRLEISSITCYYQACNITPRIATACNYNQVRTTDSMPAWKTDETEFIMAVNHNERNGSSVSRIPKPLLARLGNPKKIKFVIQNDEIVITSP